MWRAWDEALGVEVAVKQVWLPDAAETERAERLKRAVREARNAARLRDHPNVVAVHDVLVEDGSPWIVMRLVDGVSLEQAIDVDGRLPVETVRNIAMGVLRALSAAQQTGIAHRDVKPANILLAGGGEVLLGDFGIAVHQDDTALTSTGMVIGTVEYTAPERLNDRGDQGTISDLFSLGATLYAAAEGRSPFHRDTQAASMAAVLFEQVSSPDHGGELTELITGLLEKDPDQRLTIRDALALTTSAPKPPEKTRPITESRPSISKPPADKPSEYHCVKVLSGRSVRYSGGGMSVQTVAFSPDGRLLASGHDDTTVRLWDPDTGREIRHVLTGHIARVQVVAFSPDGHLLASCGSGGNDYTVRL